MKTKKNPELDNLKNQLARALADYDNLKKRTEMERGEIVKRASLMVILKLFSVLDMLENAQKHLTDQGLAIAIAEFKNVLNEEGLEEIAPKEGEEFDANSHEAIDIIEADDKKGIAELLVSGWKFKIDGQVIRPAKVKVYKAKIALDN